MVELLFYYLPDMVCSRDGGIEEKKRKKGGGIDKNAIQAIGPCIILAAYL